MALAAEAVGGVELHHGDMQRGEAIGVDGALEHRNAHIAGVGESPLQQCGLAGPGRAHEVDDSHPGTIEVLAVGPSDRVVGVEYVLDDSDFDPMHDQVELTLEFSSRSSSSSSPSTSS